MKAVLRNIKQWVFHTFKWYPIYTVIKMVNSRIALKGCHALEAFAYTGAWQARAYSHYPSYLEAWEIDTTCETALRQNLPKAVVKITNTFEEILRCDRKFDFINVDTHQGIFGNYCENFEFFPLLFKVSKDDCVVNLNVIPSASEYWRKKYGDLFSAEHLARRKAFYGVEDPLNISLEQMLQTYERIANANGYKIVWHYYQQRTLTYYLVLHLKRIT